MGRQVETQKVVENPHSGRRTLSWSVDRRHSCLRHYSPSRCKHRRRLSCSLRAFILANTCMYFPCDMHCSPNPSTQSVQLLHLWLELVPLLVIFFFFKSFLYGPFLLSPFKICYNIASALCFGRYFGHKARGISAPPPGLECTSPVLEGQVLSPGQSGMSHHCLPSRLHYPSSHPSC